MHVGTIGQLWRYPVKSMTGERLETALLTRRGIPGDRGWAVFDETRQGVTGGKRIAALRMFRARYLGEPRAGDAPPPVEITLPDGTAVATHAADAAERLSTQLGRPVSLKSLGPAGSESAPRLTLQGEPQEVVRAAMGLVPGEPDADLSALPPERLKELRRGNFFVALPIHFVTRASITTLERVAPDIRWDERRFRMNVLIETNGLDGYPELGWIGRRVRFGGALLDVVTGCPRCVMVTQAVDDVPQDHRVMRTLVRETHHTVGIYAGVAEEGLMRVGDPVELLD